MNNRSTSWLQNPEEAATADKTETAKQKASEKSGWKLVLKDEKIRQLFVLKILLLSPAMLIFGSLQVFLMVGHSILSDPSLLVQNKFAVDQATNALVQLDIGLSIVFSNSFGISLLRRRFNEEELLYVGAVTSVSRSRARTETKDALDLLLRAIPVVGILAADLGGGLLSHLHDHHCH